MHKQRERRSYRIGAHVSLSKNPCFRCLKAGALDRPEKRDATDVPLWYLLDSRKALFQVRDNIVDVLGADGQTDGAGGDALIG